MNPAFAYIYDDFVSDRRFEREVAQMETELARRGIEGHVGRMAMFRNAREILSDMMRGGVKNIVIVGNDHTLEKMMIFLPEMNVTIGYIPLMQPAAIAGLLGIPVGLTAIDVLAARLVETLDVGKLDDHYFLSEVVLTSTDASVEIEGRYRVSPLKGGAISIRNLGTASEKGRAAADPKDGLLEAVIQTRREQSTYRRLVAPAPIEETHICFKKGAILSDKSVEIFVNGQPLKGKEFRLAIVPKKIRLITGRAREWETENVPITKSPVLVKTKNR